jgi:ankyrin repeat protein
MADDDDNVYKDAASTNNKKRKADVLSRVAEGSTSKKGRGAESGWTRCPLCGRHSRKRFALGRGITAHLHAMHTPWNPGSVERKKRSRLLKRQESELKRNPSSKATIATIEVTPTPLLTWDPTPEEEEEWAQRVIQIASELEAQVKSNDASGGESVKPGLDRSGNSSRPYRESLPPFVQAAADGNLDRLKAMIDECTKEENNESGSLQNLLETRDRNGSTAQHWAAGNGHLVCLQFLHDLRENQSAASSTTADNNPKRIRRREGKTCLHYAARNGHLKCIQYLLGAGHAVDEASGDGTTALHMACYGGHVEVVKHLMANGANVNTENEWGCGCAHWVGMTKSESTRDVRILCQVLHAAGVSFSTPQKQGHSALHKAAQRKNRHVIEWMAQSADEGGAGLSSKERHQASRPDLGGHRPSEIWRSVGGDACFANQIKAKFESEKA